MLKVSMERNAQWKLKEIFNIRKLYMLPFYFWGRGWDSLFSFLSFLRKKGENSRKARGKYKGAETFCKRVFGIYFRNKLQFSRRNMCKVMHSSEICLRSQSMDYKYVRNFYNKPSILSPGYLLPTYFFTGVEITSPILGK